MAVAACAAPKAGGAERDDDDAPSTLPAAMVTHPARTVSRTSLSVSTHDSIPAAITTLAEQGEDAYDYARAGQWDKLRSALASIDSATLTLARMHPAAGDSLAPATRALAAALAAKHRDVGMRAANEITRQAAQLTTPFHPTVPVAVTLLDYYGREIEIGVAGKDLERLTATQQRLHAVWTQLRADVVAHGGTGAAARFGALVARLDAANTIAAFGALATPILDEVDALETVYAR